VHGTSKALAFTSDVTPRYVMANPFEGGKQAVAEAYRNLISVGAKPLASTDNLNFGNPEKPEIMGQFVGAIRGIGAAVTALDMPIVSGNVSLYNETDGVGILPTPTIGAVGLLSALDQLIAGAPEPGDLALVIGTTLGHLGQSALLAEAFGIEAGDAPPVDLAAERRNGEFILANRRALKACSDLSDGGLALAAFEMAEAASCGLTLEAVDIGQLFGEDQARYLIATDAAGAASLEMAAKAAGVPLSRVGSFGGANISLGGETAPLADLSALFRSAFADAVG
jgi:phosphoribosylformylglycinamidine (FGAM) synthase-like enzyme